MKTIKLKINTKNSNYSMLIGSEITNNTMKIIDKNSIKFEKCLLVIDDKIPKKKN